MSGETAWLIEETWSGYIHYLDQTFDASTWSAEAASIRALPYEWIANGTGGLTLTSRKPKIGFITKDDGEAMRFPTQEAARAFIAAQPDWFKHSDQFQAREHMWVSPPPQPSSGEWVLVPREPTEAMNKAARATVPYDALCEADFEDLWLAALSAAPVSPVLAPEELREGVEVTTCSDAYREWTLDRGAPYTSSYALEAFLAGWNAKADQIIALGGKSAPAP